MRRLLGLVVAGVALFATGQAASADELIQAEPGADATVAEVHQVVLTFDRPLAALAGAHIVEVYDGHGDRVDDGAGISTYSRRTLIVPLKGHLEGDLTVRYRVLTADDDRGAGSAVDGGYRFTVDETAIGEAGGEPAVAVPETKSSQGIVLWTVAILIGIGFAGALLFFVRLATGNSRSSLEPTNRTVFRD